MLRYALLCFAVLCFAMLCSTLLCFAVVCYALLCLAFPCLAMLWFAMLCLALLCLALLSSDFALILRLACLRLSLSRIGQTMREIHMILQQFSPDRKFFGKMLFSAPFLGGTTAEPQKWKNYSKNVTENHDEKSRADFWRNLWEILHSRCNLAPIANLSKKCPFRPPLWGGPRPGPKSEKIQQRHKRKPYWKIKRRFLKKFLRTPKLSLVFPQHWRKSTTKIVVRTNEALQNSTKIVVRTN